MGLRNKNSNITYVTIHNGMFEITPKGVSKDTEITPELRQRLTKQGFFERNIKDSSGKIVGTKWVQHYDELEGYVTEAPKIGKREHEIYGIKHFTYVTLQDATDTFVIRMNYKTKASSDFLSRVESIHFDQPLVLNTLKENETTSLLLFQKTQPDKGYIKSNYTKNNPGLKPAWKKYVIDGKDTYDQTDEREYFQKVLQATVLPAIEAVKHKISFLNTGSVAYAPAPASATDLALQAQTVGTPIEQKATTPPAPVAATAATGTMTKQDQEFWNDDDDDLPF